VTGAREFFSRIYFYDVETGKEEAAMPLWVRGGRRALSTIAMKGKEVWMIKRGDENVHVRADGNIDLFNLQRYGTGRRIDLDAGVLVSGGNAEGAFIKTKDGGTSAPVRFRADQAQRLTGFPEYFNALRVSKDGTILGITRAWRIWRISPEGKVEKVAPVY